MTRTIRSRTNGSTPSERAEVCRSAARMIEVGSLRALNSAVLNIAPNEHGQRVIADALALSGGYIAPLDGPHGKAARVDLLRCLAAQYDEEATDVRPS